MVLSRVIVVSWNVLCAWENGLCTLAAGCTSRPARRMEESCKGNRRVTSFPHEEPGLCELACWWNELQPEASKEFSEKYQYLAPSTSAAADSVNMHDVKTSRYMAITDTRTGP